nr:RHS repeat-associated core domain-containing protein [Bacteroidota bacterium]
MKVAVKNNNVVDYLDELMQGSNLLSTYNYNGTNDPFYEPYTFYTTLCNDENTYHVYDHSSGILTASFGNTRITYTPTVMPDGLKFTLIGVYDYYPYGKILREYVQGPQEKYLTTHHQRDEETGLDYRGARFYDCDVARFLSLDPLAVKYHSFSPYCYVAGNPLIYVDTDGKKIVFAKGTSPEFKKQFKEAVKYLNAHGCGSMLKALNDKKQIITVKSSTEFISGFDGKQTISWNPGIAIVTTSGQTMSPAAVLNHEVDHALQKVEHPEQYKNDATKETGQDEQYTNKEEKRVITGSEQETAKKTGELDPNISNVTRTDHSYSALGLVTSPTSNKPFMFLPNE